MPHPIESLQSISIPIRMGVLSHLVLHFVFIIVYSFLEIKLDAGWLFAMAFLCYFILMTRRPYLHVLAVFFMTGHFVASAMQSFALGVTLFSLLNVYCLSIDDSFLHLGKPQEEKAPTSEESPSPTPASERSTRRMISPEDSSKLSEAVREARERERLRAEQQVDDLLRLKRVETIE